MKRQQLENLKQLYQTVKEKGSLRAAYFYEGNCCIMGHAAVMLKDRQLIQQMNDNLARSVWALDGATDKLCGLLGITPGELYTLQDLNDRKGPEVMMEYLEELINNAKISG